MQFRLRTSSGPVDFDWIGGTVLRARSGDTGLKGNLYCGLHEMEEMALVLHAVTEDDVFVDIGANLGSYTLLACKARGATGYCFEPVPSTFTKLQQSLSTNGLGTRVISQMVGIGDANGSLAFTTAYDVRNRVANERDLRGQLDVTNVSVTTLDDIFTDVRPTIMKIDVEGFEMKVLRGGHHVLSDPLLNTIILEINDSGLEYGYGVGGDELVSHCLGYGFSMWRYDPFQRKLYDMASLSERNRGSDNVLFIRNPSVLQSIVSESPKFEVNGILV